MKTAQPIEGIPHARLALASLRSAISPGITAQSLEPDGGPIDWHTPVAYDCHRDPVSARAIQALLKDCPELAGWPEPCESGTAGAVPVDIGILTGCKATCGADVDWERRNNNALDIAEEAVLARYLWNGEAGRAGPAPGVVYTVPGQTTILGAGTVAGTATTLEAALSVALDGVAAQHFYGQAVLFVPHNLLASRNDSFAWEQRGDALWFNGHRVVGIPGPYLPGPAGAIGRWVAATGPVQWEIRPGSTVDLRLDSTTCRFESGSKTTRTGLIRVACWPQPQLAEVA